MSTNGRAPARRDHLREYRIEFCGPVDAARWPRNYSSIFKHIHQIGKREYTERRKNGHLSEQQRARIKNLLRCATAQRRQPAGEATLRENTEHIVFENLMNNAKCSNCMNYRRLPEKLVWQPDDAGTSRLEFHSVRNIDCRCSIASQSVEDLNFQGELDTFQNNGNQVVYPDPYEAADIKAKVGDKKPDRVFGLNQTPTFAHYISVSDHPRHTPFASSNLLYPFLIVEAKGPDGTNATFHNIETQSAFPIRTCLQLQQQLNDSSASTLRPLVWFIPYQGDIYGLSACIFEDEKTLVYDLWMGRSTSRDGALQLLDIIDFISVWARDVYKEEVLTCLAGRRSDLRRLTPAVTRDNTQVTESSSYQIPSVLEVPSDSEQNNDDFRGEASVIDLTMDDQPKNYYLEGSIYTDRETFAHLASHPLLKWASLAINRFPSSKHATVRHCNMVSLHFVHFTLPKLESHLRTCLIRMKDMEHDTIESIARHVLTAFMDQEGVLTTTSKHIAEIRCHWLSNKSDYLEESDTVLRANFGFRTHIRKTDWQIVRELWCVSCSIETLHSLASIIGMSSDASIESMEGGLSIDRPSLATFDWVRRLTSQKALSAALDSTTLYLTTNQTENGKEYEWMSVNSSVSQSTQSVLVIARNTLAMRNGFDLIDEGHELGEVNGRKMPQKIMDLFPAHPAMKHGAIILHKGADWNQLVPSWCLMILDDTDFEDTRSLAAVLIKVFGHDEMYFLVEGGYLHGTTNLSIFENYGELELDLLKNWCRNLLRL